jgi:hypothetical protein
MVLEHLERPTPFWDKLYHVLVDGGVFWGLTVDARHWFCQASLWTERIGIKDAYLRLLRGPRGSAFRYENYPVHYRTNTPEQITRYARRFRIRECINFAREGQLVDCFPRWLHPLSRLLDRQAIRQGRPGPLLAIRAVK